MQVIAKANKKGEEVGAYLKVIRQRVNDAFISVHQAGNSPEAELESITPTVMNLESKLEFTRVRYLAPSYLSLYSKLCLVSSALGHPGSCCMLMT